jgi:hypothetical protein
LGVWVKWVGKIQPKGSKRIYYAVAGGLVLLYYAATATGLDFLAMLIILPVGYWILEDLVTGKPSH